MKCVKKLNHYWNGIFVWQMCDQWEKHAYFTINRKRMKKPKLWSKTVDNKTTNKKSEYNKTNIENYNLKKAAVESAG